MGRGTIWEGGRVTAASALVVLAMVAGAVTASAATFNFGPGSMPTSDVQAIQGDVINVSVPPAPPPPKGQTVEGSLLAPLPTSSDGSVLPRTAASYDSAGVAHATFQAARAGTASINVTTASPNYCFGSSTSTTSTTTGSTSSASTPATAPGAATTTTTSTSTTSAAASPTPASSGCSSAIAVAAISVVVHGVGFLGAMITVPAAGSGGVPGGGVALVVAGAAVLSTLLVSTRAVRRRSRN